MSESKPKISKDQKWLNQPGYIDENNLDNMTNFYLFSHSCVEYFSVKIIEANEFFVKAIISGKPDFGEIDMCVLTNFNLNKNLERGVK